jgi:hypothetical protein
MLYDSTKTLLQSIMRALETGDESRWDDQTESGNACLYEMHQMSGPQYKAYRTDAFNVAQSSLPGRLNRAMPHVRLMVIAIRHRNRASAIENGHSALAEMNGPSLEPKTGSHEVSPVLRRSPKPAGPHSRVMADRRSPAKTRMVASARGSV